MSRLLFENSKFALGFAGLTLGAAALFAAFGGNSFSGDAGKADAPKTEKVAAKPSPTPSPSPTFEDEPEADNMVADEELIDETEGFDPAPPGEDELAEVYEAESGSDAESGGFGASDPGAAPRRDAPRSTRVSVPSPSGGSNRIEVGVAPGKGGNISISKDVKIKIK